MRKIQIKGIRHIGIVVENLEKMFNFYQNILGMRKVIDTVEENKYIDKIIGLKNIRLHLIKLVAEDNLVIELLKYENLENKSSKKEVWKQGLSHIAIGVTNIDEIYKRFTEIGLIFNSEPAVSSDNYAKICFCQDPEGNYLELVEALKG